PFSWRSQCHSRRCKLACCPYTTVRNEFVPSQPNQLPPKKSTSLPQQRERSPSPEHRQNEPGGALLRRPSSSRTTGSPNCNRPKEPLHEDDPEIHRIPGLLARPRPDGPAS